MILHEVEQGSPEWHSLRAGIPTASMFGSIVTPKRGELSKSSMSYAGHLLAERIQGVPLNKFQFGETEAMERGRELEPKAAKSYEFMTGNKVTVSGFITDDHQTMGCSVDRLVGEDGILEIKCPMPWNHGENLLMEEIDTKYIPQVQGQLMITERNWVDWMSFHPEMPPSIIRVYRDEEYIEKMRKAIGELSATVKEKYEQLKKEGLIQ